VSAELGRDGHTLAAATDRGVRVWDTQPGGSPAPRRLGGTSAVKQVALSPDGRSALVVGPRRATVLSLADGRRLGAPLGVDQPNNVVTRAAFSPDGNLIVTAQRDGTALVWSARDHRRLRRLGVPDPPSRINELHDVAFSADSRLIVTGGTHRRVRVYDARSGREENEFSLPPLPPDEPGVESATAHAVRAVALQPNGTLVAAGDADGLVRLWDRKHPAVQRVLTVGGDVAALAFSPDGSLLATAAGRDAKLWDIATGQVVVSTVTPGVGGVTGLAFSADGRRMVVTTDGRIQLKVCELCGSLTQLRDLAERQVHRKLTR
jgi:WD40 repeat protein